MNTCNSLVRILVVLLTFCVCLIAAMDAHAQLRTAPPDSGYYWEAGRGGRGWALESQDDLVFITHYVYDQQGFSTFYVTQGRWDPIGRRIIDNELYATDNGPCVGCPYVGADVFQIGTADWVFTDRDSGRIVYSNGATIFIERFYFGVGDSRSGRVKGVWHSTDGDFGVYFGEFLDVQANCVTSCAGLADEVVGERFGSTSFRPLQGGVLSSGDFVILLDSSTSFWSRFLFVQVGPDTWVGLQTTYRKTDPLPALTAGLPFIASRLFGPRYRAAHIPPQVAARSGESATAREAVSAARAALERDRLSGGPTSKRVSVSGLEVEIETDAVELAAVTERLAHELRSR